MHNNDTQKKCGFCGETIPAYAGRCPYCGSLLEVTFDNSYGADRPCQPAGQDTAAFSGEPANQGAAPFSGESADQGSGNLSGEPAGMNSEQTGTNSEQTDRTWNSSESGYVPNAAGNSGPADNEDGSQSQTPAPAPDRNQPQQGIQGQWQNPEGPVQDYQRPYYPNRPQQLPRYDKPVLSNGLKVFLTVLFTLIPGIGQLAGIITAIVFMSSDGDKDRKSFGVALLVACLILFLLSCIGCFVISLISASLPFNYGRNW